MTPRLFVEVSGEFQSEHKFFVVRFRSELRPTPATSSSHLKANQEPTSCPGDSPRLPLPCPLLLRCRRSPHHLASEPPLPAISISEKPSWDAKVEPTVEFTWKSKAPLRCRFFLWLAMHNRCWISDRLARRGLDHQDGYPSTLSMRRPLITFSSVAYSRDRFGLSSVEP